MMKGPNSTMYDLPRFNVFNRVDQNLLTITRKEQDDFEQSQLHEFRATRSLLLANNGKQSTKSNLHQSHSQQDFGQHTLLDPKAPDGQLNEQKGIPNQTRKWIFKNQNLDSL
jgi:hypothetical protein